MRRIIDLSDNQGNIDIDTALQSSDATWSKCADWAWVVRHGWPGDDLHDAVVARAKATGKLIGTYWFPRPGWSTPREQVEAWAAHSYVGLPLAPMVDVESPGSLSGGSLTQWIDEFLSLVPQLLGATPVLYWSARFQRDNGMGMPASTHVPMVAEYHYGYSPFLWADLAGWEQRAYAAYGGPDVPAGYSYGSRDLIWQFTSSSQCPGFNGLVDHSFIPDWAWDAITGGSLGSAGTVTPGQPPADDLWSYLMTNAEAEQLLRTIAGTSQAAMDYGNWNNQVLAKVGPNVQAAMDYSHWNNDYLGTVLGPKVDQLLARPAGEPSTVDPAEVDVAAVLKAASFDQLAAELGRRLHTTADEPAT